MTYLATVLADAPVHYWRGADGGGQIAHDIGSVPYHIGCGINLLGYSGPNDDGGAFLAPGANQLDSEGVAIPLVNSPCSLELWFWPWVNPPAVQVLCAWDNGAGGQMSAFWNVGAGPQGTVNALNLFGAAGVVTQRWHHLVLVTNGAAATLYIDGAFSATGGVGASAITRRISFGSSVGGGNFFLGFLSEMAIYAVALTAARVAAHFAAATQPLQAPVYTQVAGNQAASSVNAGVAPSIPALILGGTVRAFHNTP